MTRVEVRPFLRHVDTNLLDINMTDPFQFGIARLSMPKDSEQSALRFDGLWFAQAGRRKRGDYSLFDLAALLGISAVTALLSKRFTSRVFGFVVALFSRHVFYRLSDRRMGGNGTGTVAAHSFMGQVSARLRGTHLGSRCARDATLPWSRCRCSC